MFMCARTQTTVSLAWIGTGPPERVKGCSSTWLCSSTPPVEQLAVRAHHLPPVGVLGAAFVRAADANVELVGPGLAAGLHCDHIRLHVHAARLLCQCACRRARRRAYAPARSSATRSRIKGAAAGGHCGALGLFGFGRGRQRGRRCRHTAAVSGQRRLRLGRRFHDGLRGCRRCGRRSRCRTVFARHFKSGLMIEGALLRHQHTTPTASNDHGPQWKVESPRARRTARVLSAWPRALRLGQNPGIQRCGAARPARPAR